MVFVVKLWLYKLHFYYYKTMVNFREGKRLSTQAYFLLLENLAVQLLLY